MKAEDTHLTQLLEGPKQYIVPVFQRDYSWGTKHCLQLWNDIVRVGQDPNTKAHFVGSIVYIGAEDNTATINRWLVIDGQQRLTTLTLLLTALRSHLPIVPIDNELDSGLPTRAEVSDYYLTNVHGKGERRHKLHLRRTDQDTLAALLEGKEVSENASARVLENYRFFEEQLKDADMDVVYRGIKKLVAVDVSLTRGQDDPQMIFESLNSTGLDLTQADLIRNFVLMRQDEGSQTQLYHDHWQPMETAFGAKYRTEFDKFIRDYLTLQLRPSKQLKADEIYQHFRSYFYSACKTATVGDILAVIKRYAGYYGAFSFGKEQHEGLKEAFARVRLLVEVASPIVMRLYDCYDRLKTLTADGFKEAVGLLESYVFRRSVCDMQTRSLGQIFASLSYRINDDQPLVSLKVALYRQSKSRRFPTDAEFRESLESRDVYDMRNCHYLLDRLENANTKEKIATSTFTIEHVMPQNEDLCAEWRAMLGEDWKAIQETWLHRLGNITLTGYNSEYSDKKFEDKKTIQGGFNDSPLRLNKYIREKQKWTVEEMQQRGKDLAAKGISVWPPLIVDEQAVREAELLDLKAQAAKYSVDQLPFDTDARSLFDVLRPQILGLGEDIVELCGPCSVTYRVFDFFTEVIPRKRGLTLLLNLDFEECDDPTSRAEDAEQYAFIINATERGGVLFSVRTEEHVASALHIVRQAYEKVAQ